MCEQINYWCEFLKIVLPFTLGGYLSYLFSKKQLRNQKKLEFIERQLLEFYSPMIGCVKEIRAKSKLRAEIDKIAISESKKTYYLEPEAYDSSIIYNNEQFTEEIMPLYEKMSLLFTEKYYLAESETLNWREELFIFIDIWNRSLKKAIPRDVLSKLGHKEEKLEPFYIDLEKQMKKLRNELSGK